MVIVKEVKTPLQKHEFLKFHEKLYKGNPYACPAMYGDEKKIFSSRFNVYSEQAESVFFNAYKDGKMVGRIQGILQKVSNEKHNEKRIRFTRFDAINDKEVAKALFDAVEAWGKEKGMDTICGPLGYSDLDREGLLIEGFDHLNTFEEEYNFDYYQGLIEDLGYKKEVDWLEFKLEFPTCDQEKLRRLSKIVMRRLHLHIATAKNKIEFINHYKHQFFDLLDHSYQDLYMTVPFTQKMKQLMVNNFKLIISLDLVQFIVDSNDNLVAFGLTFPNITKALQPSFGHLTPACIYRVIKTVKHPEILDLGLIGVKEEYKKKGVSSHLISNLLDFIKAHNIKWCESNLNLEENAHIITEWDHFKATQHKRRRAYVKKLA